jgi:hypothetical protein
MLSPQLLELLRAWWREGRRLGVLLPQGWLFPGRNPIEPLSTRQFNRAVHAAAEAAEHGPKVRSRLAAGGEWIRTFSSAILIVLRRAGLCETDQCTTEQGVERNPAFPALSTRPPANSNSVTSGLAEFDPVLRAWGWLLTNVT